MTITTAYTKIGQSRAIRLCCVESDRAARDLVGARTRPSTVDASSVVSTRMLWVGQCFSLVSERVVD